jgi:hypothetical protein
VSITQHVFLGVRVFAGNEANATGKEGQGHLAVGIEQALFRQLGTQTLELLEKITQTHAAQFEDVEPQVAVLFPEVDLH